MTLRGLFVGLTTIDIHYGVDTFPASNAKTVAGAFVMTVGGPATNAAISFAHLGGESHLLSAIGRHPFTSFIEHELHRYHVEVTDLSPAATQLPTISSIVTTEGGQRTVMTPGRLPPPTYAMRHGSHTPMTMTWCLLMASRWTPVVGWPGKPGNASFRSCSMGAVGRRAWSSCSPVLISPFAPSSFVCLMEATEVPSWHIWLVRACATEPSPVVSGPSSMILLRAQVRSRSSRWRWLIPWVQEISFMAHSAATMPKATNLWQRCSRLHGWQHCPVGPLAHVPGWREGQRISSVPWEKTERRCLWNESQREPS